MKEINHALHLKTRVNEHACKVHLNNFEYNFKAKTLRLMQSHFMLVCSAYSTKLCIPSSAR